MLHLVLDHLMCPDMRRQTMVRVIRQKLYINTQCTTTKTTLAITAFIARVKLSSRSDLTCFVFLSLSRVRVYYNEKR